VVVVVVSLLFFCLLPDIQLSILILQKELHAQTLKTEEMSEVSVCFVEKNRQVHVSDCTRKQRQMQAE
jgi:hypothetical protein